MNIDEFISTYISGQVEDFRKSNGTMFIAILKAYYEFLEQEGYAVNASKNLLHYKDIDQTIPYFLDRFKNEFLINFPSITPANRDLMVKRIKDFYSAKGSPRALELLFRLLFQDNINVYIPGDDILRASDGIWRVPSYIEVESNERSKTFVGSQIIGSQSGATAVVDSVYTTIVANRMIDVLNISDTRGSFDFGELVTNDNVLLNAPKVTGSLTTINITNGGANNQIGDVFQITVAQNGKSGVARVVATTNGTGKVTFKLIDGGTGYMHASGQVFVSNTTMFISNVHTSNGAPVFNILDLVQQPLATINWSVATPSAVNTAALQGTIVKGWAAGSIVAQGLVTNTSSTNTFIVNVTNGNFSTATSIGTPANAILFTGYAYTNSTASGLVTGTNTTAIGLHAVTNVFQGNGAFITDATTNTFATVGTIGTGTGATFSIGSINSAETVFLFTDLLSGTNNNQIPFLNLIISGSNSNTGLTPGNGTITCNTSGNVVTGVGSAFTSSVVQGSGVYNSANVFLGTVFAVTNATSVVLAANSITNVSGGTWNYNLGQYGFPKDPSAGINSIFADFLNANLITIGSITSLDGINPGNNYNTNPFVLVRNPYIAPFNRRNLVLSLTNKSGPFAVNDTISQNVITSTVTLGYNANVGAFTVGEGLRQVTPGNATAVLLSANSTVLVLDQIHGTFATNTGGGTQVTGLTSTSHANITAVSSVNVSTLAKGRIVSIPNTSVIEIQRASFNEDLVAGTLIFSTSGGSANVISVAEDPNSPAMGNNAIVTANVTTAIGIASELQVIKSGFGYQPDDDLVLTSANNPFEITGTANVVNQGIGEGFWENNRGKLNSDKYLHDNFFYQEFSYQIQSRLSMDKYEDIVNKVAHVVGTKMFGQVNIVASANAIVTPQHSVITQFEFINSLAFNNINNSGYVAVLSF